MPVGVDKAFSSPSLPNLYKCQALARQGKATILDAV